MAKVVKSATKPRPVVNVVPEFVYTLGLPKGF